MRRERAGRRRAGVSSPSRWRTPSRGTAWGRFSSSTWRGSPCAAASHALRGRRAGRQPADVRAARAQRLQGAARRHPGRSIRVSFPTDGDGRLGSGRATSACGRPPPRACARCCTRARSRVVGASRRPGTHRRRPRAQPEALRLPRPDLSRSTRRRAEIEGLKAYPRVSDIGQPVDLAVIAVPAAAVEAVVAECARGGRAGRGRDLGGLRRGVRGGPGGAAAAARPRARLGHAPGRPQLHGRA